MPLMASIRPFAFDMFSVYDCLLALLFAFQEFSSTIPMLLFMYFNAHEFIDN